VREYTPSGDNLATIFSNGGVCALVRLKANFTSPYAHWALVCALNENGSLTLHDPTSATASSREWAPGTVASNAELLYSLTEGETTVGSAEGGAEEDASTE
jgi:hypothetical protein